VLGSCILSRLSMRAFRQPGSVYCKDVHQHTTTNELPSGIALHCNPSYT
jgi:hypothetical protein